jgi:HAD superfamily hydrolase (TIGR01509 family)
MSAFDLVIFDCDGVLVDSEVITNQVFADMLNELGLSVTLEDMFQLFVGHTMSYCYAKVREMLGHELPENFIEELRSRASSALQAGVQPVDGIHEVLRIITLPTCVASGGDHHKMRTTLGATGLLEQFEGRLYSVTQVAAGKPAPDVFLYAAKEMGVPPGRTAVVEDTPIGVTAGKAAGMTVFAYAAHTPAAGLREAGADVVFASMHELPALLDCFSH